MEEVAGWRRWLREGWKNRRMFWELSKNDFRARFASACLGSVWAYLQPLVTILVFWFIFQVGFKNPPVEGIPFIVWFVPRL